MIRGMTLVTTAVVALGLSASAARAASATPRAAPRFAKTLAAGRGAHNARGALRTLRDGAVTSLSVIPAPGRAEVVIGSGGRTGSSPGLGHQAATPSGQDCRLKTGAVRNVLL